MLPHPRKYPIDHAAGMGTQARSCSYAQAVAAARVDTSSFVYRLLTCRSTVRSLIPSWSAISRLVRPPARWCSTSTLARTEAVAGAAGAAVQVRQRRRRAKRFEDAPCCGGLELGGLVVAERTTGSGDRDPDTRCVIGRIELLPQPERGAQRSKRLAWFAFGEQDLSLGASGDRLEQRRDAAAGGRLKALDERPCLGGVATAERDRHGRLEQPRVVGLLLERPGDHAAGGGGPTLGKPEEGEAWLGSTAERAALRHMRRSASSNRPRTRCSSASS